MRLVLLSLLFIFPACKQRREATNEPHFYDGEDLALITLRDEMSSTDPQILAAMNPDELPAAIDRRHRNTLVAMDLNGDSFIDETERSSHFPPSITSRLREFDTDGDRKLDASERSELRDAIAEQITQQSSTDAFSAEYVCSHEQMVRFNLDVPEHPLWQTVMARCEGLEGESDFALSYWDRRRQRCDRARAKEKEGTPSTFLQRIIRSCNNSTR